MQRFNIDLIVRAHEMVDGYQFMFNRRLVTLFSAPEYIRGSKNSGAAMTVSEELEINFVVLRPICRREEDLRCAMNQSDAAMDLSSSSSEGIRMSSSEEISSSAGWSTVSSSKKLSPASD